MAENKALPSLDDQALGAGSGDALPSLDTNDPETLIKMMKENPEYQFVFDSIQDSYKKTMEQAQDSSLVIENKRGYIYPELLKEYPDSPTAQYTVRALFHFYQALQVFAGYKKDDVKTENDCMTLEPGFHNYMQGSMLADHVSRQCPLPGQIATLTEGYLKLRPNDTIVEYFQAAVVTRIEARRKSDYEGRKSIIRAIELFAHKIAKYKNVKSERMMLKNAYYVLGSHYRITHQDERSEYAFRKCYNLDKTSISALYAVAECIKLKDPEQSIQLLMEYLDRAPKCDEKYPHVHFLLGFIYLTSFNNVAEAKRYYYLGLEAENYRLPFNPPCNLATKKTLETVVKIEKINTCNK